MKGMMTAKPFFAALFLGIVSLLLGVPWDEFFKETWEPLQSGSTYRLFSESLSSDVIIFLLPLVSVLPYGEGFIQEYQTGAIKNSIHRSSRKEYRNHKWMVSAVSGSVVWGIGCLITFFLLFLFLFPLEMKGVWVMEELWMIVEKILRLCMIGNICSGLSGIFGGLFLSGYMAYGMPFIVYYLLVILHERYLEWLYCLYPVEWLKLEKYWGKEGVGIWIFLFLLWTFINMIYAGVLDWRLKEI